eukprot:930151_1
MPMVMAPDVVESTDTVPPDVNSNLQGEILAILQCTSSGARDAAYLHCHELECLVSEYEEFYSRFSVNDRLRLAQSYFLLASMYREIEESAQLCVLLCGKSVEYVSRLQWIGVCSWI